MLQKKRFPELLSLVVLCLLLDSSVALVLSPPRIGTLVTDNRQAQSKTGSISRANKPPLSLRIRSTREQDLERVASLLAAASNTNRRSHTRWNIEMLRNKASLYKVLAQRHRAIVEGRKAARKLDHCLMQASSNKDALTPSDRLRFMWSHDAFRLHTERAVTMATEDQHIWKSHDNFATSPNDPRFLQHAMLTAEDTRTGAVVGFCEVAMMKHGSRTKRESSLSAYVPTIANLVACSEHRRRGIASALLRSASRYVQRHWDDEIGLFVEERNQGAIKLYAKHNFKVRRKQGDKLSMTKELQPV